MTIQQDHVTKRLWTIEDEHLLRENWPTENVPSLAQKLDRSVIAVRDRVRLLGLTLPHWRKRISRPYRECGSRVSQFPTSLPASVGRRSITLAAKIATKRVSMG